MLVFCVQGYNPWATTALPKIFFISILSTKDNNFIPSVAFQHITRNILNSNWREGVQCNTLFFNIWKVRIVRGILLLRHYSLLSVQVSSWWITELNAVQTSKIMIQNNSKTTRHIKPYILTTLQRAIIRHKRLTQNFRAMPTEKYLLELSWQNLKKVFPILKRGSMTYMYLHPHYFYTLCLSVLRNINSCE